MFQIINDDCFNVMEKLDDNSIDLLYSDPPYAVTQNKWDKPVDWERFWSIAKRICKKGCPIVLHSQQPFTTDLINSNRKGYKHQWIWNKKLAGNIMGAKYSPLKIHEEILVFCFDSTNYFPIMEERKTPRTCTKYSNSKNFAIQSEVKNWIADSKFPTSILTFPNTDKTGFHPTQKPVDLCAYLIKTYSKENDLVLDPFMGSCSSGVACLQLERDYIGVEQEEEMFEKVQARLKGFNGNDIKKGLDKKQKMLF